MKSLPKILFWGILFYAIAFIVAMQLVTVDVLLLLLIGLLVTFVYTIQLFAILSFKAKSRQVFDIGDVTTNRDVDISDQNRPIPPELHRGIQALTDLQFQRLGESAVVTTSGREIVVDRRYVSADEQVVASIAPLPISQEGAMIGFESIFKGDATAWLLTMYPSGFPMGKTINLSHFRFHHVRSNLQDAYRHHRQQLDDFAHIHGPPITIRTMQDLLATSVEFRQRYAKLTLQRPHLIDKLRLALLGGLALLTLLVTLVGSGAPGVALAVIVAGFSTKCLFLAWTIPAPPRIGQLLRVVVVLLLLGLIPVILVFPVVAVVHLLILGLLLLLLNRFVVPSAKALVAEVQSGQTDAAAKRLRS